MRYKVSFCIPCFNNIEGIKGIVGSLTESSETNFQIVISDNGSNDGTQEYIHSIKDNRLKIIEHKENIGAKLNWLDALKSGDGEFIYLIMARDRINGDKIGELIRLLTEANKNHIVCLQDHGTADCNYKSYKGVDALKRMIGFYHPTGLILDRITFNAIENLTEVFDTADAYPENYVKSKMLLHGDAAIIFSGVYKLGETVNDKKIYKSQFELNNTVMFFDPPRRIKQFCEIIDTTFKDYNLSVKDKSIYYFEMLRQLLHYVSIAWKGYNEDEDWASHYRRTIRIVNKKEMLTNIGNALRLVDEFMRIEGYDFKTRRIIEFYLKITRKMRIVVGYKL